MALGLQGAYGAKAVADSLEEILAKRALAAQQQFQNDQVLARGARDDRDFGLRMREVEGNEAYRKAQLDNMTENTASLREQRESSAAKTRSETEEKARRLRAAQAYVQDPQNPAKMREAVNYYLSTGQDVPASFFAEPDATLGRQVAMAQFNDQLTRKRESDRKSADDPSLPRGVKNYIGQLRGRKGNTYQQAVDELTGTWGTIQQAHPNIDQAKAILLLRQLFNDPRAVQEQVDLSSINLDD